MAVSCVVWVIKGDLIHTPTPEGFAIHPQSYAVIDGRLLQGLYQVLPEKYARLPITDYGRAMIIPGFVDLHLHASQYEQMGLGLDLELLGWLRRYTLPAEERFADLSHASAIYGRFVDDLVRSGTTRAAVYATAHLESTLLLTGMLSRSGLGAFVGKVDMDRTGTGPAGSAVESLSLTRRFLAEGSFTELVRPILTPRFAPACTANLLGGLGDLARKRGLPVQSHLAENPDELALVREEFPDSPSYAAVYDRYGLLGQEPTLMAHAIHLAESEIDLISGRRVWLVHCPLSNLNLASGLMRLRRLLERGILAGLGTDVGAGHSLFMPHVIAAAVQISKICWRLYGDRPLTLPEAFYLATKAGGRYFGAVGSFEPGSEFDALIITGDEGRPLEDRLEKFIYTGTPDRIAARYVAGSLLG